MAKTDPRGPLVVLIGPPGSGKSTWARQHFRRDEIVSSDELRRTICGNPAEQRVTRYAMEARNAIIQGRMRFGLTTVVDSTSAEQKHRDELTGMRFIESLNHKHEIGWAVAVIFDTPLDVCLARNAQRPARARVPEQVIRHMHAAIQDAYPVASTWIPFPFDTGLRVDPEDTWRMGRYSRLDRFRWVTDAHHLRDHPGWVGLRASSTA